MFGAVWGFGAPRSAERSRNSSVVLEVCTFEALRKCGEERQNGKLVQVVLMVMSYKSSITSSRR